MRKTPAFMRANNPVVRYNAAFQGRLSTKKPCFPHFSLVFMGYFTFYAGFCLDLTANTKLLSLISLKQTTPIDPTIC